MGSNFGGTLGAAGYYAQDTRCVGALQITAFEDAGEEIEGITCSSSTMMAWTKSGRVFGWGSNTYRLLLSSVVAYATPTLLNVTLDNVVKVSIGREHALALSSDGKAVCWGRNRWFQCNTVSTGDFAVPPVPIYPDIPLVDISAGAHHTLALDVAGNAYAAGFNAYGQTCETSISYRAETAPTIHKTPVPIVGEALYGRPVRKIAASIEGSYFVTDEGRLFGCGKHSAMGFGTSRALFVDRPREIFVLPPDQQGSNNAVNSVFSSSTAYHTLFTTSDLRLAGVGVNSAGELGLPLDTLLSTKTIIPLPVSNNVANDPVVQAGVSGYQTFVKTDSTLTRPASTILPPQCEVQGCQCPSPLPDAICSNGTWYGPNLIIWDNITISQTMTLTGNLTIAPGGSLTMPFGSVLKVSGCTQFVGGTISFTMTPAQLLQVYRTPLLFVNTSCGTGLPLINLNVNGTVDPCNNVSVSSVQQRPGGYYLIFSRSTCEKQKVRTWIIGAVIGAVVALVVLVLLLIFFIRPLRLIVFPFYKRQISQNKKERQALRPGESREASNVPLADPADAQDL